MKAKPTTVFRCALCQREAEDTPVRLSRAGWFAFNGRGGVTGEFCRECKRTPGARGLWERACGGGGEE